MQAALSGEGIGDGLADGNHFQEQRRPFDLSQIIEAVKESSDSEPRRGAGESPREVGGYKKNWTPRSIVFSSRFARARVSLNCKRALPCSGRRCVCAKVSLVSAGAPRHGPALPA